MSGILAQVEYTYEVSRSGFSTWASVLIGVVVVAALVTFFVLYFKNEAFKQAVDSGLESISDMFPAKESKTLIRKISPQELQGLMASIGSLMAAKKYVPQSQTPGLSVFQKEEPRGCLMTLIHASIAIILLCMCIVPGVLYIMAVAGKGDKLKIVSVQVSDIPQGYNFNIKSPGSIKRNILQLLTPYRLEQQGAPGVQMTPVIPQATTSPPEPVAPPTVEEPPVAAQVGTIIRDVVIGGSIAFQAGEQVSIVGVSPDASRPDYKYVVHSEKLGKKFKLSDNDVAIQ